MIPAIIEPAIAIAAGNAPWQLAVNQRGNEYRRRRGCDKNKITSLDAPDDEKKRSDTEDKVPQDSQSGDHRHTPHEPLHRAAVFELARVGGG